MRTQEIIGNIASPQSPQETSRIVTAEVDNATRLSLRGLFRRLRPGSFDPVADSSDINTETIIVEPEIQPPESSDEHQLIKSYVSDETLSTKFLNARDNPEALDLIDIVQKMTETNEAEPSAKAPFANYKENDEDAWAIVPDSEVQQCLSSKFFMDTHELGASYKTITVGRLKSDQPFEIPLSKMVSAAGFGSWSGRRNSKKDWYYKSVMGSMDSYNVIKHYAGLPTEIPPIDTARIFVQPNGLIFCDNASGDSHRVAAAVLRGQETIKADKVAFLALNSNILGESIPRN